MDKKGFTVLELLAGAVIIIIIVLIAFPLGAIRGKRSVEAGMKNQLMCIKDAEEAYRSEHGSYTTDTGKLARWKHRTKRYQFRIRYASSTRFLAEANGDLNNDKVPDDTWTIDENGVLTNVK